MISVNIVYVAKIILLRTTAKREVPIWQKIRNFGQKVKTLHNNVNKICVIRDDNFQSFTTQQDSSKRGEWRTSIIPNRRI